MKVFVRMFGLSAAALLIGAGLCLAEETAAPASAAPSAEQQAKMEKMKQAMTPGPQHKALEPLAGKWNYTSRFWTEPNGQAQESTGTSDNEMIYGGRFLKESVKGTMMGEAFEGIAYTGYDNVAGEYTSVWIDSMATGLMKSSGTFDGQTMTLSGTVSCPINGKNTPMRTELKIADNDHHTLSAYMPGPDGKEFKNMEMTYTRAA
jgi:hypothetical protein